MSRSMSVIAAGTMLACSGKPEAATQVNVDRGVRIGSDISCTSCAITIDTVATLPHIFALGSSGAFARDTASGAIYVVDRTDNLLKAFSSEGRYLHTIGRRGGGPGEYEQVRNVLIDPEGAVHILDGLLARHTVFTAEGTFLGSQHIDISPAFMNPAVLRTDGQVVVNNPMASGAEWGENAVGLIDTAGHVVRAVDPVPVGRGDRWWVWSRIFWKRPNDVLLVGRRFAPIIDIYGPDFIKRGSIRRVADWFPEQEPQEKPGDGVFDKPISPSLEGMWEDVRGRLWLQMLVASPDWTPRQEPARFSLQDYRTLGERPRAQTIIEVVDEEHWRVLARSRIEGGIGVALGGGFIADYIAENTVGEPEVRILRVVLKE